MNTHADRTQENKSQSDANAVSHKQSSSESTFQFVDNRPEAIAQRKLQEMANNSPQVKRAAQLQTMADNHSARQQPIQKKENNTGLPDNLKTGMENLSGMSLDDVKVNRNSDKPAQLQAHAYAQGTDIHLGPGQEKHLPHEAWHVVQQKQGKVKPTMQMKGKVNVNNDAGLENEADVMGAKAIHLGSADKINETQDGLKNVNSVLSTIQRVTIPGVSNFGNFIDLGNGLFGTTQPTDANEVSGLVNEIRTQSAQQGIHQNIKVITGTHGDATGHLIGETVFYTEDLAHEGHKVAEGGWINVLNVKGKSKETIENWMSPGSSAIILAWCYSKTSVENWDTVSCYKNEADYHAGNKVW